MSHALLTPTIDGSYSRWHGVVVVVVATLDVREASDEAHVTTSSP